MRGAPFPERELAEFWLRSRWAIAIATALCAPLEFAVVAIQELELEAHFLSSELGLLKPDRSAFGAVVEAPGATPSEVLFLDDTSE
jgi:hypothetical protein